MSNLQKDLLKCSHRNSISLHIKHTQVKIEISEEIFEKHGVLSGDLNGHLTLYLCQFADIRAQTLLHVRDNLFIRHWIIFDDRHHISNTETTFEEHGRAKAGHLALGHDPNPIRQNLSFVHVVSRQQNYLILLVALKHIP